MDKRVPPGPSGNLALGNLLEFRRDPLGFFTQCAGNYGDIVRYRIAHVNVYLLNHPDLIESVLVSNHHNFIKGRTLHAGRVLLGDGLLTSEGDSWRRQRRLMQPAFHRERIAAYGDAIVESAQRMLASWCPGETRDVHQAMVQLTLQIIAQTLFGAHVEDEAEEVSIALQVFLEQFRNQVDTALMIPDWLPTPGNLRLGAAIRRLEEIIYRIIRERRANGAGRGDLLSLLLHAQDQDGSQMTDRQLRDEVMTLFLAGHETTAVTLAWTWYLLSQHPAVEAKLIAELEAVLGERPPTVADLPNLNYAEKVVKESLRLYPPVWAFARVAVRDCEIGGYPVREGTSIAMSQWVMHRDARYFHRPDEFIPDRWTGEFTRQLPRFVFFPFSGGPRGCIGSSFAMMEAVLLLATMAQQFHLTLAPGNSIELWPTITLHPRHGMPMVVAQR
jgi:cytochrome P450